MGTCDHITAIKEVGFEAGWVIMRHRNAGSLTGMNNRHMNRE